jgi:hypothetical protein
MLNNLLDFRIHLRGCCKADVPDNLPTGGHCSDHTSCTALRLTPYLDPVITKPVFGFVSPQLVVIGDKGLRDKRPGAS